MRQYTSHPGYSMYMSDDKNLQELLKKTIKDKEITHVLETGTFQGKGSTRMVAEAFLNYRAPEKFVTIEANYFSWIKAVENLKPYPFVTPVWGLSLNRAEAIKFVEDDEMLKNADKYPDVYCDGGENPHQFYIKEIKGELGNSRFKILNKVYERKVKKEMKAHHKGDDLLVKYLTEMRGKNLLVLLDSAGGVGYLEFKKTIETLKDQSYLLILDDIHHVKHYRSYQDVKNSSDFTIIGENYTGGWVFAEKK